jgi:hypothetical protein
MAARGSFWDSPLRQVVLAIVFVLWAVAEVAFVVFLVLEARKCSHVRSA